MAEMTFEILTLEGEKIRVNSPLSYEWSRDADAACDGIRLSFLTEKPLGEAVEITAYLNGEKVFFGFADYQSEENSRAFVYARSSACILVDNEAPQAAFNAPSAASLYGFYAKPFGFKSRLKRLFTEYEYTVSKGESCYGAINAFASAICSKNVAVSPENELYVPDGKTAFYVDPQRIIGIKKAVDKFVACRGGFCGANTIYHVGVDEKGNLQKCWENVDKPNKSFGTASRWDPADPVATADHPDKLTCLSGFFISILNCHTFRSPSCRVHR